MWTKNLLLEDQNKGAAELQFLLSEAGNVVPERDEQAADCPEGRESIKSICFAVWLEFQGQEQSNNDTTGVKQS